MIVCVRETDMAGDDVYWHWNSIDEAMVDERFDFYWENDIYTEEEIRAHKNIEDLIEFVGHPFYLVDGIDKVRSERRSFDRMIKIKELGL